MKFLSLEEIINIAETTDVQVLESIERINLKRLPSVLLKCDSEEDVKAFFVFAKNANVNTVFAYTEEYERSMLCLTTQDLSDLTFIELLEEANVLNDIVNDMGDYNQQFQQYEEGVECNRVLFFYKENIEYSIIIREEWLEAMGDKENAMIEILYNYKDELQEILNEDE
ncbi:hypothetical protein [Bacillus thuringiensis]|uniref:hypothetical protein n=1 Tax=Bacillus thuringiensis TaxID=1428 RepID=UPI00119DBB2A|nr:hypothetical protein [Bacillus thuringiensis]